jgi:hypothetical protein
VWVWFVFSWWCVLNTTLDDKVCQWLTTKGWLSPGSLFSSKYKTEVLYTVELNTHNSSPHRHVPYSCHDMAEKLLAIYTTITW